MNNDQTMKNTPTNSSFSFLQDMYIYYFSSQISAKNAFQNNHPLYQIAARFNYDTFPRETIVRAIENHQNDVEIFLPEALYLPTMISESYFEAAQYECDLPVKERIDDLQIISYDFMRALLAFEYQFKPEFIASNDIMKNKWRNIIYIIKCAADFPDFILGDFLIITRCLLSKLSAAFQAIYSAGSDTITLYTTFVNSLIHLNHKSIKDTKSFDFLLGSICSHFKYFAVDPSFFEISQANIAEYFICIKTANHQLTAFNGEEINNFYAYFSNILSYIQNTKGEEWFSVFCLALDSLKIIFTSYPGSFQKFEEWMPSISKVFETYIFHFNINLTNVGFEKKEPLSIDSDAVWFAPKGTFGEYIPINLEPPQIKEEPHTNLLISSFTSVVMCINPIFDIVINYVANKILSQDTSVERNFLAIILQTNQFSHLLIQTNVIEILFNPNVFQREAFLNKNSIQYWAICESFNLLTQIISRHPPNLSSLLGDLFSKIILYGDPVVFTFIVSYIINLIQDKYNFKFFTSPVLYDSLIKIDAKFRTIILRNPDKEDINEYKNARATLLHMLKVCLTGTFANTLFFCNQQRTLFFFDLIFEQDTRNFAIEAIHSSLISSKAPFSLINSFKEWILSLSQKIDDQKLSELIVILLVHIASASSQNPDNIVTAVIQSDLDKAICCLISLSNDEKICTQFLLSVCDFLILLCNDSFKYIGRISQDGFFDIFVENKNKFNLSLTVWNSLFSVLVCKKIEMKSNTIECEQIVVKSMIPCIYKLAMGTCYSGEVIQALYSLSKYSIGNQYQFFKSNIICDMIDYVHDNYTIEMIETPFLSHISTSFFHKNELSKLLQTIVKPPMTASRFFVTLINLIFDQQNKSDRSTTFFHVTGVKRNFEKTIDIQSEVKIYVTLRTNRSNGTIIAINDEGSSIKVVYYNKKIIVQSSKMNEEFNFELYNNFLYHIVFRVTETRIYLEINKAKLLDKPVNHGLKGKVTCHIGGIICDLETIMIFADDVVSKYSASLTNDYQCIDVNTGKVDAIFKGLIIPYTPTLSSTFVNCGGPMLILPVFEATPNAPKPNEFLASCIDLFIQMTNRMQNYFIHQKLFRSLNAVFRKLSPEYFDTHNVSKLIALYNCFTYPKIRKEIEEFLFGDPALFQYLIYMPRYIFFMENPYSKFLLGGLQTYKNFPLQNFSERFLNSLKIIEREPFSFNDATTLVIMINDCESIEFSKILLTLFKKMINEKSTDLLSILSQYHFYYPFVRFFKYEELEEISLQCIIRVEKLCSKSENIHLLSTMQTIAKIIKKPIESLFDTLISRISEDRPCFPYLPLICKLIEFVDRTKQKAALFIIRKFYEKFEKPFSGWITYMFFLAQLDQEDSHLWMPILARIIAKNIKLLSTLLLFFDITVSISGLDYLKCFGSLTNELSKSTLSYHAADKDSLICLMRWIVFKFKINYENPHCFTSFDQFISVIKSVEITFNNEDIFNVDQSKFSDFCVALLKATTYGGGLTFNNIELRTLYISLFKSIMNVNHDLVIDIADYLTLVATNSSNTVNFRIPAVLIAKISGELAEKYNGLTDLIKKLDDGQEIDISHDTDYVSKLNDELSKENISNINEMIDVSVKTDVQLQEEEEIYKFAAKPILPIYNKIKSTMKIKHAESDLALSRNMMMIKGGTVSFWRNGAGDVHYGLSDNIDSFGRHARIKTIKHFKDHADEIYEKAKHDDEKVKETKTKLIAIDKDVLQEKLAESDESFNCSIVNPKGVSQGTIFVLKKSVIFEGEIMIPMMGSKSYNRPKFVEVFLAEVGHILWRRYQMVDSALEMFTKSGQTLFIIFHDFKQRNSFLDAITKAGLPSAIVVQRKEKMDISKLTKLWQERVISNYEYIYWLNMYSGRSFSDITQYPIFPWVIKDYKTNKIDLNDETIYRDFDKMVGEFNEERLRRLIENQKDFSDDFGHFYVQCCSNPGFVVNFLLRVEPFTTLAIDLQSGHFDNPNRIFSSIATAWENVTGLISDFRELIPEFFTTHIAFENLCHYPFGTTDDGVVVNDVILPPWAKSAFQFVRLNRLALESPYVSNNINKWIDLMFGYLRMNYERYNVFPQYSYPEKCDVTDELMIANAMNFGIMPSKLFDEPHPKRLTNDTFCQSLSLCEKLNVSIENVDCNIQNVAAMAYDNNIVMTIDINGKITSFLSSNPSQIQTAVVNGFFGQYSEFGKHICFNLPGGTVLYTTSWRTDFDVYNYQSKHKTEGIQNNFMIPCLHSDGDYIVVGSVDSTVTLINNSNTSYIVSHSAPIVDAVVSQRCGLIASIDSSNKLLLSNLNCSPIATTNVTVGQAKKVLISELGCIVVIGDYNNMTLIEVYTEECRFICRTSILNCAPLSCCIGETHDCGSFLFICGSQRSVNIYRILDLTLVYSSQLDAKVKFIDFSKLNNKACVILENDEIKMLTLSV